MRITTPSQHPTPSHTPCSGSTSSVVMTFRHAPSDTLAPCAPTAPAQQMRHIRYSRGMSKPATSNMAFCDCRAGFRLKAAIVPLAWHATTHQTPNTINYVSARNTMDQANKPPSKQGWLVHRQHMTMARVQRISLTKPGATALSKAANSIGWRVRTARNLTVVTPPCTTPSSMSPNRRVNCGETGALQRSNKHKKQNNVVKQRATQSQQKHTHTCHPLLTSCANSSISTNVSFTCCTARDIGVSARSCRVLALEPAWRDDAVRRPSVAAICWVW